MQAMDTHYLCLGDCGATSAIMSVCENRDCLMYNLDFQVCECTDGKHAKLLAEDSSAIPDDIGDADPAIELDEDELAAWEEEFGERES